MIALDEAKAKRWLRECGLNVPWGAVAHTTEEALATYEAHPGPAVVKALVPTGRRGKSGAVVMADDAQQRGAQASRLIGAVVNGLRAHAVYIEDRVAIEAEYYLAFVLSETGPQVLVSRRGGIDIEDVHRDDPEAIVKAPVDPLAGLSEWAAIELWSRAGICGRQLPRLGALTRDLYNAFCRADALTLEINPLALGRDGQLHLVGAMMGVDPNALFRQSEFAKAIEDLPENPRERAVVLANREPGGGECRYVELAGDIGLLVGGGGAGLYQHDLILALGGEPANHCVTPPTSSDDRKLKAVLSAILDNPSVRGLLLGFNFAQMARADVRVKALVDLLDARQLDTSRLPIVIRLFGAGEEQARAMVAGRRNIHYVPRGTSLEQAARLIVELTREAAASEETQA